MGDMDHQPAALDADATTVLRRELELLKPEVRADRDAMLALLHPDFREEGASGGLVAHIEDLTCTQLAPGVVQVGYTAHEPDRVSRRSSVWVSEDGGPWLLRFRRRTVVPDPG